MKDVIVLGRFPPPIDGQAMLTRRLADLLETSRSVRRVDVSFGDVEHVPEDVQFSMDKVRHYAGLRSRVRHALRELPEAPVLWASISPAPLGHLRDVVTLQPAFQPRQRVFGIVHWGNFDRIFRQHTTRLTAKRLVGRLRGFVFNNAFLADKCSEWIPSERTFLMPNTIDDAVICDDSAVATKRASRRGREHMRLLFLSNMIPSKGYLDVLEAVGVLEGKGVRVHADFIGRWSSDEDHVSFNRSVDKMGLGEIVTHHGGLSDRERIRQSYLDADVFVLPSYYPTEAQPVTIIEALNAGTPIVTTRHAGIPYTVDGDENALFVPPRDPFAIADAVENLANVDTWDRFSTMARRRFERTFSPDAVRQGWLSLLDSTRG